MKETRKKEVIRECCVIKVKFQNVIRRISTAFKPTVAKFLGLGGVPGYNCCCKQDTELGGNALRATRALAKIRNNKKHENKILKDTIIWSEANIHIKVSFIRILFYLVKMVVRRSNNDVFHFLLLTKFFPEHQMLKKIFTRPGSQKIVEECLRFLSLIKIVTIIFSPFLFLFSISHVLSMQISVVPPLNM